MSVLLWVVAILVAILAGAAVGLAIGVARERMKGERALRDVEGRARASEAQLEELRRQAVVAAERMRALEGDLFASERARASAEARVAEMERNLEKQRALLEETDERLRHTFQALAADALARNNEGFLALAAERLGAARVESELELEARHQAIEALVKPVRESLDKVDQKIADIERERASAYGKLVEQVRALSAAGERLEAQTGSLARALRAPNVRGRWGELQLRRVVEIAGMQEHCDFGQQVTLDGDEGRTRPDLVVRMPGDRYVVVDAKVPLDAYLEAHEAGSEEERAKRLRMHATALRGHMLRLASKAYWSALPAAPEFVVLFLPGEPFVSAALEAMPGLLEEGMKSRVLIATPTTLMALLHAVNQGWREKRLAENAQQISDQGRLVHERLAKLMEHWGKLGQALDRATLAYNEAVGSWETRVRPSVRKLEELGAASHKEIPEPSPVDVRPRAVPVASAELPGLSLRAVSEHDTVESLAESALHG